MAASWEKIKEGISAYLWCFRVTIISARGQTLWREASSTSHRYVLIHTHTCIPYLCVCVCVYFISCLIPSSTQSSSSSSFGRFFWPGSQETFSLLDNSISKYMCALFTLSHLGSTFISLPHFFFPSFLFMIFLHFFFFTLYLSLPISFGSINMPNRLCAVLCAIVLACTDSNWAERAAISFYFILLCFVPCPCLFSSSFPLLENQLEQAETLNNRDSKNHQRSRLGRVYTRKRKEGKEL